jgi:hypothetical protein
LTVFISIYWVLLNFIAIKGIPSFLDIHSFNAGVEAGNEFETFVLLNSIPSYDKGKTFWAKAESFYPLPIEEAVLAI